MTTLDKTGSVGSRDSHPAEHKGNRATSRHTKHELGSVEPVTILGGTLQSTALKREASPSSKPLNGRTSHVHDNSPPQKANTLARSNSFMAPTVSSRRKGHSSDPSSPALHKTGTDPFKKSSRHTLHPPLTLPGSDQLTVIARAGSSITNKSSRATIGKPSGGSDESSPQDSPIPSPQRLNSATLKTVDDLSAQFPKNNGATSEPSSPALSTSSAGGKRNPVRGILKTPPSLPGSSEIRFIGNAPNHPREQSLAVADDEDDDNKEPTDTTRRVSFAASERLLADVQRFAATSNMGPLAAQMMLAAIQGLDDVGSFNEMMPPDMPSDQPVIKIAPKIESDTLNPHNINSIFLKTGVMPKRQFQLDEDLDEDGLVDLSPVAPNPQEIRDFPFSDDEVQKVKQLNLFHADISDDQLIALVDRFGGLERISITLCPSLTDAGIQTLGRLKNLKSVDVRFCPKVTCAGMEALPLEFLEEFGLSTNAMIEAAIVKRLTMSQVLRRADFILCPKLTPEALIFMKDAHRNFPIAINLKGCDRIKDDTLDAINKDRAEHLITFKIGVADRTSVGLPKRILVPPRLQPSEDLLTTDSIQKVFGVNTRALPHASVIREHEYTVNFRGFDLEGRFSNDSINALVERFPDMQIVRIWDNSELSYPGIVPLREFRAAKVLFLGKLPGVSMNMLQVMFSHNGPNDKNWQALTDLHLTSLPISDDSLQFISYLPNLRSLTLASCDSFTVQGIRHLIHGCPALQRFTIADCSGVDIFALDEFRAARPQVEIHEDSSIDLSAVELAVQEVDLLMWSPTAIRQFHFLPRFLKQQEPIPEKGQIHANPKEVTQFYEDQLARLGIRLEMDKSSDLPTFWMRCDQVLQAYQNIIRTTRALRKEIIRVGFFTNVEQQTAPETAKDLLRILIEKNETLAFVYRRKVRFFDFSGLGLTRLPLYLLEGEIWEQLEGIKLEGNFIQVPPDSLVALCPKIAAPASNVSARPATFKDEESKTPDKKEESKWSFLGFFRKKKG